MTDPGIIVVSGPRGRGKTTWVHGYLETLSRVLVVDAMGEYGQAGSIFLPTLEDLLQFLYDPPPTFRAIVTTPGDEADFVFRAAWALGPVTVVAEEADRYRVGSVPLPGLQWLIEYGRHRSIGVIAVTRRPAAVPRSITANATRAVVFHTVEPRDLLYWREYLPDGGADGLASLSGHDYLDADLWTGSFEVVRSGPKKENPAENSR